MFWRINKKKFGVFRKAAQNQNIYRKKIFASDRRL